MTQNRNLVNKFRLVSYVGFILVSFLPCANSQTGNNWTYSSITVESEVDTGTFWNNESSTLNTSLSFDFTDTSTLDSLTTHATEVESTLNQPSETTLSVDNNDTTISAASSDSSSLSSTYQTSESSTSDTTTEFLTSFSSEYEDPYTVSTSTTVEHLSSLEHPTASTTSSYPSSTLLSTAQTNFRSSVTLSTLDVNNVTLSSRTNRQAEASTSTTINSSPDIFSETTESTTNSPHGIFSGATESAYMNFTSQVFTNGTNASSLPSTEYIAGNGSTTDLTTTHINISSNSASTTVTSEITSQNQTYSENNTNIQTSVSTTYFSNYSSPHLSTTTTEIEANNFSSELTTSSTSYDSNPTSTNESFVTEASAINMGSIMNHWTKTEIIIVLGVTFILNIINLMIVVMCVYNITKKRSHWDRPPIRYDSRLQYANSQGPVECIRALHGRDLASDIDCKGGENPMEAVPVITKDAGWCVPYNEGAKSGKNSTEDTGV